MSGLQNTVTMQTNPLALVMPMKSARKTLFIRVSLINQDYYIKQEFVSNLISLVLLKCASSLC